MPLLQNCKYAHSYTLSIVAKYALLFCVYVFFLYGNSIVLIHCFLTSFIQHYVLQNRYHIAMSTPRPLLLTTAPYSRVYAHHMCLSSLPVTDTPAPCHHNSYAINILASILLWTGEKFFGRSTRNKTVAQFCSMQNAYTVVPWYLGGIGSRPCLPNQSPWMLKSLI